MRVGRLFALVVLLAGGSAYAALPQCNDGIDNDGDGLIDFTGGSNGLTAVGPDPQCRSATWNSEASASDMGPGGERVDSGGVSLGDGGVVDGGALDDANMTFVKADGMSDPGGGTTTAPNVTVDPPRQGCDMGGPSSPALPILIVLALGGGLALLSRRTRT